MKKIAKILPVLCLMIFVPVGGFALFDVKLYGGFPVAGHYDGCNQKIFAENGAWGVSAHLNNVFLEFLQLGLGGFYQESTVKYKSPGAMWYGDDFTLKRHMIGLDAYAQLEIPLLPLCPYIRVSTVARNKITGDTYSQLDYSHIDNFERHGIGGGVSITLVPIPALFRLQAFLEYAFEFGKEDDKRVRQGNLFLGLKADILP